jgi:hypothetical protein
MKGKYFKSLVVVLILTLAGCYRLAPGEDEISTVPVTNNPHAMPGPMNTSPMPSSF